MAITVTTAVPNAGVAPGQKIAVTGTELDTVDFFAIGGKVAQVASVPARTATAATLILAPDTPTGATAVSAFKGANAPVVGVTVGVVAASTANADSTSSRARKWGLDVMDPAAGNAWTKVWFITNLTPLIDPQFSDAQTYDDDGAPNQGKAGVDVKLTVKIERKKSRVSGLYDRGQEILRATLLATGGGEVVTVRWYDKSGGADDAYQCNFDVQWNEDGGGPRDNDTVTVTLMGKGLPVKITNPAG